MSIFEIVSLVLAICGVIAAVLVLVRVAKIDAYAASNPVERQLDTLREQNTTLLARQDMLVSSLENSLGKLQSQLNDNSLQSEQKLDNLRRVLSDSLTQMQQTNTAQLGEIRKTVDEKLHDALDKKLHDSFRFVSERLEQVYKGLGEMQALASGVGDLKKVLSNVKTRGTLGEIQLGAILEQILSPEQYATNVAVKSGSRANVEFAVKLPGEGSAPVWLPIDSKFPLDAYSALVDAYETADAALVGDALKALKARVREFARDIHTKYVSPPETTDFAIMFLPTEGLYAELVRAGMVEALQQEFKISIAGPTTMGALLNSLQMGFRTLAIHKRSGEVWTVLGNVKAEFESFATVLESAKKRLDMANQDLDRLVGVRTRQIQRALRDVESLPGEDAQVAFKLPESREI